MFLSVAYVVKSLQLFPITPLLFEARISRNMYLKVAFQTL
jgi:hypothetical protein